METDVAMAERKRREASLPVMVAGRLGNGGVGGVHRLETQKDDHPGDGKSIRDANLMTSSRDIICEPDVH